MDREKKFFRKKRRAASSILSWILAFAIIASNGSTAQAFTMTALAAENEVGESKTVYTGESSGIGNGDETGANDNDDNGTGDGSVSNDGEGGAGAGADDGTSSDDNGTGGDTGTDESTGTGESTVPGGSDDDGNGTGDGASSGDTGNKDDDSDTDNTDDDTDTDDSGEGTEENEGASDSEDGSDDEEESDEIAEDEEDNSTGKGERVGEVKITLHFYNALNWGSVYGYYFTDSGNNGWPGELLDEDTEQGNGWYKANITASASERFGYIFNNGSGTQTANAYIETAELSGSDTYELWTWVEADSDTNGQYNVFSSAASVCSPEVNGGTVTFRYKNDSVSSVYLAGTMNGWSGNATKMEKDSNGIFTCEENLEHGEYQYKFVVGSDWKTDPFNPLYVTTAGNDYGNSLLYVPGDTTYNYTIHYYDPSNPDQAVNTPDLYIWENDLDQIRKDGLYTFESKEEDTNGISWLTMTISLPCGDLGMFGRPTAESWDGQDQNQYYQLTNSDNTDIELWYIFGQGVYDKKPLVGDVKKVEASLYYDSMDYTRNNVLSLMVNDSEEGGTLVNEAYVDASALGMSDKLMIDPELMEISLSVTQDTQPGSYELPITVIGKNNSKVETEVTVEVTAKPADEDDFDWDEAVIYFMVTDRFFDGNASNNAANGAETYGTNEGLYHGGDFAGVTEKLDYLQDLGVNTIWITPIVENIKGVEVTGSGASDVPFNAAYHGYWASDFRKLNPALGTDDEFKTLIDTAHAKGMKIMVDVVVNHAGYGAEENFPGMLRETVEDQSDYVHGGGQSNLPDFITEDPEVRDQIIEWQVNWANKGVDYFRVDTVKHVDSTTWMAFKNELAKANPKFKMIGEYFDAGYASHYGKLGSGQMDSLLDFNFNDWAADFVKGNISGVEQSLAQRNAALNNTYLTGQFLSSHDENGFKYNLQNSGITGEAADAAAMVAATLQITAKGQPVIYYGEEIGLTGANNYPYQTNRYDFDWDEVKAGTTNKTYAHYKKMLDIREQYSEIFAKGDRKVVSVSNQDGYDVISRGYNGETVYVGMNIKSEAKEIKISVDANGNTEYTDLYNAEVYPIDADGTITVTIPAAADGGTVVLAAGGYVDSLTAPELTVVKGKTTILPAQLTHVASDGSKTPVDVSYSMEDVEGVTLDKESGKLTVDQGFTGSEITLTAAAAGNLSVTFTVKVVEDKNEITLRLHYTRKDGNYTGWNVWAWADRLESDSYDFDETGENGEKVVTLTLEGRAVAYLNYIIRKSVTGNEWLDKDVDADQQIDLSDVLSGTVDYYVESGVNGGKRVLGDDVLLGVKVISATYNKTNNTVKVVTGLPVEEKPDEVFTMKSAGGTVVPVTGVKVNKTEYTLSLGKDLSQLPALAQEYFLGLDGYDYQVTMPEILPMYSSEEFEEQFTYEGDDLGASWSKDKTTFKVWAPTADKMKVNLYKSGTEGAKDLIESIDMTMGDQGVWTAEKTGDLNGTYYTYTAVRSGVSTEACDPYARTTGVNGDRAMVIDLDSTDPDGWANDRGPNRGMSYNDSVIYELHVRDFSIDESSGISADNKGKFLGLTEKGTTNAAGQTTGLDYLTDLGVTHIHLLPSYDYGSVDESKLDEAQYNWGYDPVNYNVPEGSYSTDPYNGEIRVKEMKQMVKTLHDNNINVIMDVVYNHVYNADEFCFNQLVPQYFSRTKEDGSYSNASGCGNDTASERAMVKKYIVDSVNYWADEYHIDGFRFDLVGLLDVDTINEVVDTVHVKHPDAVFYGEGWTMDSAVSKPGITMATQTNSASTPNFAYFSDTIRDAIKGDNFDVANTGFVNGKAGIEELISKCFMATTDWCKSPTQTINYASCHDNYTLWDKISESRKDASQADRIRMNNLAAAIYMTAEGIPLIHAGEELLRTKVDENGEVQHNSYNLSDYVNSIKWNDLDKEDYRNVRDYYKGLIEFRKNHAALRLTSAADVSANVDYKWITNEVVMFVIGGKDTIASEVSDGIVVIFNATNSEQTVSLYNKYGIAEGTWNVCINDQKAGIETLDSVTVTGTVGEVKVAPISAMVLVKGETEDQDSIYDKNDPDKKDPVEQKLQELKKLITDYEDLEQGSYTDESWKTFTDALEAAKTTAGKSGVTEEEIDQAKEALQEAYEGLTEDSDSADTSVLEGLVEEYEKITDQGDYTDESWAAFKEALEDAKTVLTKTDATQEEIDQAKEALQEAYDGLKVPEGSVDTSKLAALIEQCGKLTEQGNYTTESWEKFTAALEDAKTVLAKTDATQEEIDQALTVLREAYDGLTEKPAPADTSVLEGLVEEYEKITDQGDYTDESWAAFKEALEDAKTVLAKTDATQEEIDQAKEALQEAYDGLKVPEGSVDTGKLAALIEQCGKLTEQGNYTTESWEKFTAALEDAKTVLAKTDATQEEIDQAQTALREAYDGLTEKPEPADTSVLEGLVEEYEKITDQGDYTDESWAAFKEALEDAKTVLAKTDVTQEEIDQAKEALQEAYDGLKVPEGSVDTGKLAALIEQCGKLTEQGNYTTESWEKFTVALEDAKTVLAKTDATQEEIDQALAALREAYDGLMVNPDAVDTSALEGLVAECDKIANQDDYTQESWAAFKEALKEAENVLAKPNATQEEIDRVRDELQKALEGLEDAPHGLWVKWADDTLFTTDEDGRDHITYTGKAIKPIICVYDGRRQLKEKTDYTVAYKLNTNAGEAVVTVKGKGNYTQQLEQRFIIDKVDLNTLAIADLYGVVAADNQKQMQLKPVVKYNGKTLKLKTDYTVAYENPNTDGKAPGVYKVTIQAAQNSKNYMGSKDIKLILADKTEAVLMSKVSVKKIPAQPYEWDEKELRGKVQTPEVIVTYGKGSDNKLICKDDSQEQENWDYEVIYDTEHTEAGETATITVRGNGRTYVGEKTTSFKITGTPLKANKVSLVDVPKTGLVYTGSAQEPQVKVDGIEETGYKKYSVEYQKNTNVGTATVIVTGINGYTGTVKKNFKITAYDIGVNEGSLFTYGTENVITDKIPYAKGGSKLTNENVNASFSITGGEEGAKQELRLEQGIDYTLSYKKNMAVGDASVSIKGKGNYKGTIKDIPFTIIAKGLGDSDVHAVAGDILVKNARKYNTVIPVITDANGKKLKNKTDFTVDKQTAYTYADGTAITETPTVGSVIKVTAKCKGNNYSGEVSALFRVIANNRSIAAAKVNVEPQRYTGKEVQPGKEAITVKMKENGNWVEIDKANFEIIEYSNNIKKGTAKVTIRGLGDYGGTKTVKFKIAAKPMILGTR